MNYDVFISHATEDKDSLVRPLAVLLTNLHVDVWYDEFSLNVGDSLSSSIDKGLIDSRFGLIVLSKEFMEKKWTDYELRSLISKEINYGKTILPIWHGITKEELIKFSPFLVDKIALNTINKSIIEIALEICKIVKPNVYDNLTRVFLYELMYQESKPNESIDAGKVQELIDRFPIRHDTLPKELINRITLVYEVLKEHFSFTLEESINNFKCDTNPAREIKIWEAIASTYLEIVPQLKNNFKTRHEAFGLLMFVSTNQKKEMAKKRFNTFSEEFIDNVYKIFNNNCPYNTSLILVTS